MAMPPTTYGLLRNLPKMAPDSAAPTPSAVNITAMPRTKTDESPAACMRLLASLAPKTLTVMAIIG